MFFKSLIKYGVFWMLLFWPGANPNNPLAPRNVPHANTLEINQIKYSPSSVKAAEIESPQTT